MPSQWGIKYAVHIIKSLFGDLVAKVCECILRKGTLTRPNIIQFTELTPSQVKNCLLVLIQHNCVQAFHEDSGDGDGAKSKTEYMAVFDNIIHRSRFPKFMAIVLEELDKPCLDLFEGLLQHGRLTIAQMIDRARSSQNQAEGNDVVADGIRESFSKLLNLRFVERCPAPEPVVPIEAPQPFVKRGSKSAKLQKIETETFEQRLLKEAGPSEAMRFMHYTDSNSNLGGEEDVTESPTAIVGKKRNFAAFASDEGGASDEQGIPWRANFEEFLHRLRHKACINYVKCEGSEAVIVLSAMLEATRDSENKVKVDSSASLSLNSIYEEVIKNDAGHNMTFDSVRKSLTKLGSPPLVKADTDSDTSESYIIDFKTIIGLAQDHEIESVVSKRYGQDAYKIFRVLSLAGHLVETDKIVQEAFLDKKPTLAMLMKLWKENYLLMEKVVIGPQSWYNLWKVDKEKLHKHFLDEMFHAALNLSLRLDYELEQELVNPQGNVNRIRKVRILLESSRFHLDNTILLFQHF